MVSILSLWLPILLSGVLVFIASSIIHVVLSYHDNDFSKVPDEDKARDALRSLGLAPGNYVVPHGDKNTRASEDFRKKAEEGPVTSFTVYQPGAMLNMGPQLTQWFVYTLVVAVVAAYVAGRTLAPGADYLAVFRLTGTVAFACYAMGMPQESIWYKRNWTATLKSMFDGLLYACLAAGLFGWLWPM